MYVAYHGTLYKVYDFVKKPCHMWLDIGVGYLVRADRVDIV